MPTASRDFQIFAKPAGAACNLACGYCYYVRTLGPDAAVPRMAPGLLESYIVQHIDATTEPVIRFSWHGGEPTLLGLEYFRAIVELQRKHAPAGRRIANGIQTNGLLVDDAWCRFFAEERFAVGLSLDGPADVHDAYRVTRGGQSTHRQVIRSLERLQQHHVAVDILCVVHNINVHHPLRVYRFLRGAGVRSLGFLPVVERLSTSASGVSEHTVPADAYGTFLCSVFDEWAARDQTRVAVQNFDEALRPARGLDHSVCIFRETCGQIPVVEHDGAFYACDHFVDPAHRIGSIEDRTVAEMLDSPRQQAFGAAKRTTLATCCLTCDLLAQCNGGCPKDRIVKTTDGEARLNYLCPAFTQFFRHCRPFAATLAAERRVPMLADLVPDDQGLSVGIGHQGPTALSTQGVGRNDPCPCGSGRKFKKCCRAGVFLSPRA